MKLNALEFALMNNPIRAFSQRTLEAPRMFVRSERLTGQRLLEIGCGRGVGIEILLDRGAKEVTAIDIDPAMVELARKRLARHGDRVRVAVGDVQALDAPDAGFDGVVDFGILHHVPDWQKAIREIARVLAPGGVFYFEDVLEGLLAQPSIKLMLAHPESGQFSGARFRAALEAAGLHIVHWEQWAEFGVWGRAVKPIFDRHRAAA